MSEKGPENLESNDKEPDDEYDTVIETGFEVQTPKLEEIKGELTSNTLKRARDLMWPIRNEIEWLEMEYKNNLRLLPKSQENEEKIQKNTKEIEKLKLIKDEIEKEARRQISDNKKFREGNNGH